MSQKKQIAELKARLKAFREQCKKCDAWECGHCAEPKWDLEQKIERLKAEARHEYHP
jgi:hypothetical protein